jgi:hypothetical protein
LIKAKKTTVAALVTTSVSSFLLSLICLKKMILGLQLLDSNCGDRHTLVEIYLWIIFSCVDLMNTFVWVGFSNGS